MEDFAHLLVDMLTAETVEQTVQLAFQGMVTLVAPAAACLLLWDEELQRYIIGETWLARGYDALTASEVRRRALGSAMRAYKHRQAHCVEPGVFYQPLDTGTIHVGAYLCIGVDQPPDQDDPQYAMFVKSVARALSTTTRLAVAAQEHSQLLAERERLEQLLKAVEEQERTIDRLLTAERQFSANLEAKVQERTAELQLAQARLIQSEKLAIIGKLASSLAHELNNPLQAIQSGLGLVISEINSANSAHVRGDLHVIQAELERIQSIFRQMLDFYRPVSFDDAPLALNEICEGVRALMRKRLEESRVALRLELAETLPSTCGDSNQIKQVLLNLILNSVEAMPPHGGTIRLQTTADGHNICLRVADDGTGISQEHQQRLFEPLFTTKTRGLGLGLALSQEIVQRHGGHITVSSHPGSGTTFAVYLPIRERCHHG